MDIDLIELLEKQIRFCKEHNYYQCGVYTATGHKKKVVEIVLSNILQTDNNLINFRKGYNPEAIFDNGSKITIVSANESARGHRFCGIIIYNETDKKCIDYIIMPHLMPWKKDDGHYDENDNPIERLYYVGISNDDVDKSECIKNKQLLYVSSANYRFGYSLDFKKEYKCMWIENKYDRPIITKELNNEKVMLFEAQGIPADNIEYKTEFINKTRETYLNITGQIELVDLGFENKINVHMLIDTDIYDGYQVHIDNGLVTVILHEIVNEMPVLKNYSATKAMDAKVE